MKKSNAILILILLFITFSVIAFISLNKDNENTSNSSYQQEESDNGASSDNQKEKQKNKPHIKAHTEESAGTTEGSPENTEKTKKSEAAETQATDDEKYDNTVTGTDKKSEDTLTSKAIESFEGGVAELVPSLGTSNNADAAAGSFWDEPLVQSVYSRFSASEIALAAQAMSGSLSGSEKKAVKDMIYGRVSASEIAELERLYQLHGGK
ncbi:MAG: hypothetical protein J5590_04560 [Clostridia bacterium]|nr:hypothetical protein [Clostridia bacterium]